MTCDCLDWYFEVKMCQGWTAMQERHRLHLAGCENEGEDKKLAFALIWTNLS